MESPKLFSTPAKHMPSNPKKPLTLKETLSSVADFRIDRRKKYPLYEILMITVCAMIDGARGPTDFWRFGRGKIGFLRKFLPLVNGIPSHDTFRRVLGKLDTKRFNAAVVRWIQSVADISGDFVSIDGKLLRRALTKDGKARTVDKGHGRIETRTCWQTDDIDWLEDKAKWAGLKSVCMVTSEVYDMKKKTTSRETRYFISSMPVDPARALQAIRAHWGVEAMHWILDMDFDEDRSRARTENIAENLAMLRHIVLNVLRLDKSIFGGISVKRKELVWDDNKLLKLMIAA